MPRPSARRTVLSPLLTLTEVADALGLHRSTLYRAISRNDFPLPVVRIGSQMRVPKTAVQRLLGLRIDDPEQHERSAGAVAATGDLDHCSSCGSRLAARTRPTCSAARRSSSGIASV